MHSWSDSVSPLKAWLKSHSFQGELRWDEPLSKHTYYRIGGAAQLLAIPTCLEDLKTLADAIEESSVPWHLLGLGSNILASDAGFDGIVIKISRLNLEVREEGDMLYCGSSVANSSLLRQASERGWGGLELLVGIPGSIGGAVAMNAGTHLGETESILSEIEIFDLRAAHLGLQKIKRSELQMSYRKNASLSPSMIVYSATLKIRKDDPAQVASILKENLDRRKRTQPVEYPSCGSVFKNPLEQGYRSWEVIEKLGLRGHRVGDAQFSEKHPNFIINLGKAKASDVATLINLAKTRAQAELGVTLEEEVKYLR